MKPGPNLGKVRSIEERQKQSVSARATYAAMTPEQRQQRCATWAGREHTPETKAKIGAAQRAAWASDTGVRRKQMSQLGSRRRGVKLSEADKLARSVSVKRSWELLGPELKRARIRASLTQGRKKTSLEAAVERLLILLGVEFCYQEAIGAYFVDFYIPTRRLVIECDGGYWHSLPGAAERDAVRDTVLTAQGYTVLRLPEHEIKSGACLSLLQGAVA